MGSSIWMWNVRCDDDDDLVEVVFDDDKDLADDLVEIWNVPFPVSSMVKLMSCCGFLLAAVVLREVSSSVSSSSSSSSLSSKNRRDGNDRVNSHSRNRRTSLSSSS